MSNVARGVIGVKHRLLYHLARGTLNRIQKDSHQAFIFPIFTRDSFQQYPFPSIELNSR